MKTVLYAMAAFLAFLIFLKVAGFVAFLLHYLLLGLLFAAFAGGIYLFLRMKR